MTPSSPSHPMPSEIMRAPKTRALSIQISALGPTISDQCAKAGFIAAGMQMDTVDRVSHGLTMAHIHGILTDSEVDRARNRLLKKARLEPAPADCPDCYGTGVDGDVGIDGRTVDIPCGRCHGTGRASIAAATGEKG